MVNFKNRLNVLSLNFFPARWLKVSDIQKVIFLQYLPGNAQFLGYQADGGDTSALTIAPISHLY